MMQMGEKSYCLNYINIANQLVYILFQTPLDFVFIIYPFLLHSVPSTNLPSLYTP